MGADVTAPAPDPVLAPWQRISEQARARRRKMFLGLGVLFAVVSAFFGFPTGREVITAWVLALLLAACGGEWRVWRRAVLHDWGPLIAVLFAYDLLRGQADEIGGRLFNLPALDNGKTGAAGIDYAHVLPQLRADEVLFGWFTGGQVPTVWLQDKLYVAGDVQWYDAVIVPVYMSHFIVPMALAVALWITSYHLFRRYVWTLVSLTLVTLATYAAFPAAPPWMASLNGYLPEGVVRVTSVTLQSTGVGTIRSAVQQGEAYANAVAAIPSLHSAVPFMVLLFTWPLIRRRSRVLLVLYVLAMTFTLTYGGEHYIVDAFIGWAYAAAAVYGVAWWFGRRERREPVTTGAPVAEQDSLTPSAAG
jgi:hypothetical protein